MPDLTGLSPTTRWCGVLRGNGDLFLVDGHHTTPIVRPASSGVVGGTNFRSMGVPRVTTAPTFGAISAGLLDGTYIWRVAWYNADSQQYGSLGPASVEQVLTLNQIVVNFAEAVPSGYGITHWAAFRTIAGGGTVLYFSQRVAAGTTTYTDNNSDVVIRENDQAVTDRGLPPTQCPYIIEKNGRMVFWGSRIEAAGTVTVTNGSPNVTGSGTEWRKSHEGQKFYVANQTKTWTILTVTDATHLILTENWTTAGGGVAGAGKDFKIQPVDPNLLAWSRAGELEAVPVRNRASVGEGDSDHSTGCFQLMDAVYLAKSKHLYRMAFNYDPNPVTGDGSIFPCLKGRGLASHGCAIVHGNMAYCLDRQGFYIFDGGASETPIDLPIRPMVATSYIPPTDRINWEVAETFHGQYEPRTNELIWFVAIGTEVQPFHAICFSLDTNRWRTRSYQQAILCSCRGRDLDGVERIWIGDSNGFVQALSVNPGIDGAKVDSQYRGAVDSATSTTLVDAAGGHGGFDDLFASLSGGLRGSMVEIYEGVGAGQSRWVQSNTINTLTLVTAWTTIPAAGDKYRIGPVETVVESQWFSVNAEKAKAFFIKIFFQPFFGMNIGAPGRVPEIDDARTWLGLTIYKDFEEAPWKEWSVASEIDGLEIPPSAATDGEVRLWLDNPDGVVQVTFAQLAFKQIKIKLRHKDSFRPVPVLGYEIVGIVELRADFREQ